MNKKIAFTLIELLVVIAVIGILSGLIVVSMNGTTEKASIAKGQIFSNSVRNSLMDDIVAEWKFEENAGQVISDSWGGINNCTVGTTSSVESTDPTWTSTGCLYGKCLSFDGSNDFANCGSDASISSLGSLTISTWIKPNNLTTQQAIWGSGVYRISFGSTIGGGTNVKAIGFVETGIAVWTLTGDNVLTDGWMNIVYTKNGPGATANFYLNGKKMTLAINGIFTLNNSGATYLGTFQNNLFFNGLMDDTRIYNTALSGYQIKESYFADLGKMLAKGNISGKEYLSILSN